MNEFNFRLQPVLTHRQRIEDRAKQEYARAKQVEETARHVLANMEEALGEGKEELIQARSAEIDASQVGVYQRYLDRLKQGISDQANLVAHLNVESEEKREEVVSDMKARKMVERLREHQYEAYKTESDRHEQKQIDEFAVTRYHRKEGTRKP